MTEEIRRTDPHSRYELVIDGRTVSYAEFFEVDGRVVFPHTVTLPEHRGNGYAERVVRFALDDVRAAGKTVVPQCWFVHQFIESNPDYRTLLAA